MMRLLKFNIILFLAILVSGSVLSKEKFEKKDHKEFLLNSNSKFEIANKFGNINIENWKENKLSVDVIITVEAKNKDKAESVFEKIKITIEEEGDIITAITEIEGSIKNADFEINYFIKMPEDLAINLSNKFGSVNVNKLTGNTVLKIEYGNLEANGLIFNNSDTEGKVLIAYGNADIKYCTNTSLSSKYSSLEIKESDDLSLKTSFSSVETGNIKSLTVYSKYDSYELGNIYDLTLSGKFSDIEIEGILSILKGEFEYGNFELKYVAKDFSTIDVLNKYGDVSISFDENVSYLVDGNVKSCKFSVADMDNLVIEKDGNSKNIKGYVGSNLNTTSKVTVSSKYGNVKLD